MSSTRVDPMVVIVNRYARLEERVTAWVEDDPGIRAAVVIGSRTRTDHPADEWAAKHLRRGELWWAKSCCDGMLQRAPASVAGMESCDRWRAREGVSQRAWVVVSVGPLGRISHLEVPDQEAGVARSFRARSGRPEASRACWNVSAGTRRNEV